MKPIKCIMALILLITFIGLPIIGEICLTKAVQEWVILKHTIENKDRRITQLEQEVFTDRYNQYATSDNIFGLIQSENTDLTDYQVAEIFIFVVDKSLQVGVDPFEVFAIMDVESDFHNAPGKHTEYGMMQPTHNTWLAFYKQLGFKLEDFKDWRCNTLVGMHKLKERRQICGSLEDTIGQYNGGKYWRKIESSRKHVNKFWVAFQKVSRYREKAIK